MTGRPGSGLSTTDFPLQRVHVGQTCQTVLAVDVHRVRTADAFAARAAERQRRVLCLELHEGVEQHAFVAVEFDHDGLHVGLGVGVRVVAVDLESAFRHGDLVNFYVADC
jgi:hypothetical protein